MGVEDLEMKVFGFFRFIELEILGWSLVVCVLISFLGEFEVDEI